MWKGGRVKGIKAVDRDIEMHFDLEEEGGANLV